MNPGASHDEIFESGYIAFLEMYGAPASVTSLNRYRHTLFEHGAAQNAANLKCLCPTEGAAREHSKRVYVQMQAWLNNELPLTDWGWRKENNIYVPIGTAQPPAPNTLLKKLFCNCRKGCAGGCGCRKLGTQLITFVYLEFTAKVLLIHSYLLQA